MYDAIAEKSKSTGTTYFKWIEFFYSIYFHFKHVKSEKKSITTQESHVGFLIT